MVSIASISILSGVLVEKGLNTFIFEYSQMLVQKLLESDKTKQMFTPYVPNYSAQFDLWSDRQSIFLVMNKSAQPVHFNPIVMATKTDPEQSVLDLDFTFDSSQNIVELAREYWQSSGLRDQNSSSFLDAVIPPCYMMPQWLAINIPNVTGQVMDYYYRCAYLIIGNNEGLIPVYRTGILPSIKIYNWNELSKLTVNLDKQMKLCKKLSKVILSMKNIIICYNEKKEAIALTTESGFELTIPIKKTKSWSNKYKSIFRESDIIEVDQILHKTTQQKHMDLIKDKSIAEIKVLEMNYLEENYKLFIFHLSYHMSDKQKKTITNIMNSNQNNNQKEQNLVKEFTKIVKKSNFFTNLPRLPETKDYQEKNFRIMCTKSKSKNTCDPNHQCVWRKGKCLLGIWQKQLPNYIQRLSGSMINSTLLVKELLQIDDHNLSNLIDPTKLTVRKGELIFREGNPIFFQQKIKELLNQYKHISKKEHRPQKYPIEKTVNYYIQLVLPDNLTLFRAIANVLFWEDSKKLPIETRNLGYKNQMQEIIALYLKNSCLGMIDSIIVQQTNIHILKVVNILTKILERKIQLCMLKSYKVTKILEIGTTGSPIKIVIAPWEKKKGKMILNHATTFYSVYE